MRRGEHLHAKRADPTEALGIVLERRRTVRWHPRACEPSALQGLSSRAPITTNHSFAQFSVNTVVAIASVFLSPPHQMFSIDRATSNDACTFPLTQRACRHHACQLRRGCALREVAAADRNSCRLTWRKACCLMDEAIVATRPTLRAARSSI